jgi:hypothetical protein
MSAAVSSALLASACLRPAVPCLAAAEAPLAGAGGKNESAELQIGQSLDDFHEAAAKADEERYFSHFAKGAVFLGTDATERWDVDAFRAYAHPHFAKKKAWTFRATSRHVVVSPTGLVAWFDEALETVNLGPARGSGVLVRERDGSDRVAWRVAQYNLTITVPNDRFADVKRLLAASPAR